jgi:lambda family phage portal protein
MAQEKFIPPQNLLDKAIAYVAPTIAKNRLASRMQLALAGGYTGARTDITTLARWGATAGSPDVDIIKDLPTLRARSRDQMRNSPLALGALNQTVSSVVGTGLSHSAQIDAEFLGLDEQAAEEWQNNANRRFATWANSADADIARTHNFYQLQDIFFRSWLESGDGLALTPMVKRDGVDQLALQVIEADLVCNPNRTVSTETLVDGIEIDAFTREPKFMHVAAKHPGSWKQDNTWTKVPIRGAKTGRRNVLHAFKALRPGQVRGVPWIAPILEPLKQLNRWTDAELNAAVVSSMFSVFLKMDPEAFQSIYDEDAKDAIVSNASSWSGEMQSGKAVNLLPGESVESPAPGRPNPAFDPFWQAIVRQIGMALELPYEVLTMHFQSSYSAARGALLMAWKFTRGRRDAMATAFCQPVYELWLENEVAQGRITAPGFFADRVVRAAWCAGTWTGDGPGSIDPEKEVNAAIKRVELGISTKQIESMLHDGGDWETKHRQRVKEINAEKEDGVFTLPAGVVAMPATGELPAEDAMAQVAQHLSAAQHQHDKDFAGLQQQVQHIAAMAQAQAQQPQQQQPAPIHVSVGVANEQITAMGEQMAIVAHETFSKGLQEIREVVENMPIVIPAPNVTVEAIMPEVRSAAPVVNITNEVQPSQVTVVDNHPKRAVQKVERDANDEIVQTVTTYER